MFLEVIASNIDDVVMINKSNADRIEFCDSLLCGGLTPNLEDIKKAAEISDIPVNVIIRVNESWDFIFTEKEKTKMLEDIKWIAKNTMANGIVIGALNNLKDIDEKFLKDVIKIKGNLEITFHKAFDQLKNKDLNWKILENLDINNVLTSGGDVLEENYEILKELKLLSKKTKLLIGGGVNSKNIYECLEISENIHMGTAVRELGTWDSKISIDKINMFKKIF